MKHRYLALAASLFVNGIIAVTYSGNFIPDAKNNGYYDLEVNSVNFSAPTMLVYPFENLTSSEEGENSSSAITESMISSLSWYAGISVLSSNTSMEVKTKILPDAAIKKLYNDDFVIWGSVQSILNQPRIQMQLTDLSLNKVVWTDKVDFAPQEIFKVQDKIGDKILARLQINAVAGSEA